MSFDRNRWSRQSDAMNTGLVTKGSTLYNGPAIFSYASADDAAATIEAANYFAPAVYDLAVGDLIFANGSDAFTARQVSAVDRDAETITTVSVGLNDSIATANIDDLAVTTAKLAAGAVTSAKLAEDLVQTATVTVSTAELLDLAASPKEIVAAPGAGKFIQFLGAQLVLDYNSAAYVDGGYNLAFRYTDGSGVIVSEAIEATGFADATADTITNSIPKKDAIVAAAGAVNQALVLDNTGAGEWTTGDSDIDVMVLYKVVTSGL